VTEPYDYFHLLQHVWDLFPKADIEITYEGETIHIDVNGYRYTFEIGSDDDAYVFSDGTTSFTIPLFLGNAEINPDDLW
jgi:hypothetical protein